MKFAKGDPPFVSSRAQNRFSLILTGWKNAKTVNISIGLMSGSCSTSSRLIDISHVVITLSVVGFLLSGSIRRYDENRGVSDMNSRFRLSYSPRNLFRGSFRYEVYPRTRSIANGR